MEHSKLVGTVSTDHGIYAVRWKTAPTERRKCPFIFRIHYSFDWHVEVWNLPLNTTKSERFLEVSTHRDAKEELHFLATIDKHNFKEQQ